MPDFSGKIDPAAVAFDIDGVIADTMNLFLDIARDEYQVNGIRYEDICCYQLEDCLDMSAEVIEAVLDRILTGEHQLPLKPYTGAANVLARVARYRHPLLMVTARPSAETIRRWMTDLLPVDPGAVEVVATGSFNGKADVLLKNRIRYFVEDRLDTCFQLKNAGIEPVVFRQPWNRHRHPFAEVGNWQELEALIRFDGS
jgi:5'(3')-deoxyribonucleotidase